jgi:hypothetical protein
MWTGNWHHVKIVVREILVGMIVHVVQTDVLVEHGPMFFLAIPLALIITVLLGPVHTISRISFIHRTPIGASIGGYDVAILIYFLQS